MIVAKTPKVVIEGKPPQNRGDLTYENGQTTYTMRRLSTRDTFTLISVIELGARASGLDVRNFELGSLNEPMSLVKNIGHLIFTSMAYAQDEVINLCASLLGVDANLFSDGEYFPMGSEVLIMQSFVAHPDCEALIKMLGNALREMQPREDRQVSQESSTQ